MYRRPEIFTRPLWVIQEAGTWNRRSCQSLRESARSLPRCCSFPSKLVGSQLWSCSGRTLLWQIRVCWRPCLPITQSTFFSCKALHRIQRPPVRSLDNQSKSGLFPPQQQGAKREKLASGRKPHAHPGSDKGCFGGRVSKDQAELISRFSSHRFCFVKTFLFIHHNARRWLIHNTHSQRFGSERQRCADQSGLSAFCRVYFLFMLLYLLNSIYLQQTDKTTHVYQ